MNELDNMLEDSEKEEYKLHPQFVGSLMMAFQYAALSAMFDEEDQKVDLGEVVSNWVLQKDEVSGLLMVMNPPTVSWEEENAEKLKEMFPDETEE